MAESEAERTKRQIEQALAAERIRKAKEEYDRRSAADQARLRQAVREDPNK